MNGFSSGLMSTAPAQACADHDFPEVVLRQLKLSMRYTSYGTAYAFIAARSSWFAPLRWNGIVLPNTSTATKSPCLHGFPNAASRSAMRESTPGGAALPAARARRTRA